MTDVELIDELARVKAKLLVLEYALIGHNTSELSLAGDAIVIHAGDAISDYDNLASMLKARLLKGD
jgi:hypothetical protein